MRPGTHIDQAAPYDDFAKALANLRRISAMAEGDIVRDALLKRFALACETAWRFMGRATKRTETASSPEALLIHALDAGLIEDIETWRELGRQRRRAAHAFEEAEAAAIADFVRRRALPALETLRARMTR